MSTPNALAQMGVMLHTGDLTTDEIIQFAQAAEKIGFDGFWVTEESGKEAFAVLATVARETSRIQLGTGIVNFYSRTPTLLAMGASTIYRMSDGRFTHFGLGSGGVGFMERGHGIALEKPLARGKEYLAIIRGLLTQPRFSYQGQWFHPTDFHLREGPVEGQINLYLSALGPKMVGLAARVADGLITNWLTEESYANYRAIIDREAASVGRDPASVKIFSLTMMAGESDEAVEAMRRGLAFYFASDHYHPIAEVSGFGAQAKEIQRVWETGDFAAASRMVSDAMVEKFAVMGSPATRRAKLAWMRSVNVYPIMYPILRRGHIMEDHLDVIQLAARYAQTGEQS